MRKILFLISFVTYCSISLAQYKLVWQDNFDGSSLNTNNWRIEVNGDGGYNNELQYYEAKNIAVGAEPVTGANCLKIIAQKETVHTNYLATSGRINSIGKVSFKYGKIEARIKLPTTGNGLWPAFWMLGQDIYSKGWPKCGEIDILEMGAAYGISHNTQSKYHSSAIHYGESSSTHKFVDLYRTNSTTLQSDFHLFTVVWDENYIKFYLDLDVNPNASPYFTVDLSLDGRYNYFRHNFGLVLNLAVGGNYTGITGNSNIDKITALGTPASPSVMYVDYVRIYQLSGQEYVDSTKPTAFTAEIGQKTSNSVELVLNASDNSGVLYYTVSYGSESLTFQGNSGASTSCIIPNLDANTNYQFSITAKDANGNIANNSPLILNTQTSGLFNTRTSENIKIYPNPSVHDLTIACEQEIKQVDVCNLLGQKIFTVQVNNTQTKMDINGIAPGQYLLNIMLKDKRIYSRKIVKI